MSDTEKNTSNKQTLGQVVSAVFGAFLGVRSSKSHQEDHAKGRASSYIVVGIIGTAIFIGTLLGVVQLILHLTAK